MAALTPPPNAPALYSTERETDPTVYATYYHAGMGWTWFLLEYDPENDLAFGLVDGFFEEMGYFTLAELGAVGGTQVACEPLPLSVARLRRAA